MQKHTTWYVYAYNMMHTKWYSMWYAIKHGIMPFSCSRPNFVFSCGRSSPIWNVSGGARNAGDRPRTEDLSRAKALHNEFLANRPVQTTIPPAALRAQSTSRLENLASPKSRPEGPFRAPDWPVSPSFYTSSYNIYYMTKCME